AVVLTYIASAMGYAPGVIQGVRESSSSEEKKSSSHAAPASGGAPQAKSEPSKAEAAARPGIGDLLAAVALLFAITLAAPVLAAAEAPLGLLIVAFGLWEAWKLTRGVPLAIEGPFRAAAAANPAPAA